MGNASSGFSSPLEHWNSRFDRADYIFGTAPNEYLASQSRYLVEGRRILMVADGEGRNSVWCAQQGMRVDAFDLSPVAVEKAKRLATERGVQVNYQVSGIDDWSWEPDTYDVVAAIFVQFATPRMRARLFANCLQTLRPGGIFILQGYTPKQLEFKTGGPPVLEHLYTEPMLRDAFSSIEILEMRSYEAEINEGAYHAGMSALVGMVGRKPGNGA